ncbi:MAG TPA: M2 family metallopeptidase [Vicinamibacterales bacterium]|nr:M2 family metallopeptidase [Vicinamibacterales bacterium]
MRPSLVVVSALAGALLLGCQRGRDAGPATADEAHRFIEAAQARLQTLGNNASRAGWVQNNFITVDTQEIAANAQSELAAAVSALAREARRFEHLQLPYEDARKLRLLKLMLSAPAPDNQAERDGLSSLSSSLARSVRALVSRADLIYTAPVAQSEEGIPIGNGRIGTVVWTTPRGLKFQINRVDVQPINRYVDLELAGARADVFTTAGTHQRLSIYEGILDVKAAGVNARLVVWPERDVIAIEVEDRRPVPEPIQINMHTQRSGTVHARGGRILILEHVLEGTPRAKSALAIALLGRRALTQVANETEARIVSPGERGRVVILIASAATRDARQDVAAMALSNLDAAAAKSFDDLAGDTAEWWHDFWERSTIALHSADETYNLYLTHAIGNM